ncbi:MAG: hypothetical protein LHW59_11315 [Candidatus Cloacimonetes bacterium]|nr:hypothetical protein [Candidatus Cloacimonadota bacterium]
MAELSNIDYTVDNLIVGTKKLITVRDLQLEAGQSVVRGEVLAKGTTGLVALAAITDTPYCVALETIDATSAAADIAYTYDGAVLESELTYGAGTIADFRDKFVTETRLIVVEG